MIRGKKISVVIPCRFASVRFEGKPLSLLMGKPMIYHVYKNLASCNWIDDLIVATDDERIRGAVQDFGGRAVMTSSRHPTGTDRIAEVAEQLNSDIVVNVQGDEPMIKSVMLEEVIEPLLDDNSIQVSNLITEMTELSELIDVNVVKAAKSQANFLLYLTRSPIPHPKNVQKFKVFKQLGVYAFRRCFLKTFVQMAQTDLELVEGIEFLRLLETGHPVKAVVTRHNIKSVDTPSDLREVEQLLLKTSQT